MSNDESQLRAALRATENEPAPDVSSLIVTLRELGQSLVARGAFEEARDLLTRALELAERPGSIDESDQALLLNELGRLHLKQGEYAAAEPLLRRLLTIKEAQGRERPEVASVLATLAGVRNALGDHTSAEELYRHALDIRERTLPPNHITTAATLESLSEAVAARGHFEESVALSRRALTIREAALGPNDPMVRLARARIADLLLQSPEEIGSVVLRTPPKSQPTQSATPLPSVQQVQTREAMPVVPVVPVVQVVPSSSLAPWAGELVALQQEIATRVPMPSRADAVFRGEVAPSPSRRPSLATVAIVLIVGAMAALGITSQLRGKDAMPEYIDYSPPGVTRLGGSPAPAVIVATAPALEHPAPAGPVTRSVSEAFAAAVSARTDSTARKDAAREPTPVPAAPKALPRAFIPSITLPDIDAAGRVDAASRRILRDSFPGAPTVARGLAARSEPDRAPTAPRLIGAEPQPRYPELLRDLRVQGEVLVQFVVDENGVPDLSTVQVVRSPHELLTNAVRAVLRQFRFEPARTAGPGSKPRAETVKYGFTFNAPAR